MFAPFGLYLHLFYVYEYLYEMTVPIIELFSKQIYFCFRDMYPELPITTDQKNVPQEGGALK